VSISIVITVVIWTAASMAGAYLYFAAVWLVSQLDEKPLIFQIVWLELTCVAMLFTAANYEFGLLAIGVIITLTYIITDRLVVYLRVLV